MCSSTISQEVLVEKGGWDFTSGGERLAAKNSVPPEGHHKPIKLERKEGSQVPWENAPFQVNGKGKIVERNDRPIKHLWKWTVAEIIDNDATLDVLVSWNVSITDRYFVHG